MRQTIERQQSAVLVADLEEHWKSWAWRRLPAHRYMIKALAWMLIQRGWRKA